MSKKTLKNIRNLFLNYFSKHSHQIVDSSNLVPSNDPTLMFTNSGMVQFKNVFTGLEKRSYKRATTSQKCVRAGGKHNDLENVGYTPRHHTFFEMLGNFSFGDYFKEKAIYLAWELLTKEFQLPKEKLCVTVYSDDNDSYNLWKKITGLSEDKIIKISTSDNFWSMGDTGPCGPCSEIFYDHGDKLQGGLPGSSDQDGDRFIEIWNLVFMQYEQISKDKRINLPKPSVDTGMGLERISAVLQGTHDNYKTDHFKKIMSASSEITKCKIDDKTIASHRVIADHLRASSFLIAEGILPSNEGRGYVLRRIMRRGMRHAHSLGSKKPIFYQLFNILLDEMSKSYPELDTGKDLIIETLKNEEEKFSLLLDRGIKILNENLEKIKNNILPGAVAFKLYDTYGFPLDLTADILRVKDIKVDKETFIKEMEKSKKLARSNWKGSGDKSVEEKWFKIRDEINPTEFLGYEFDKAEGVVVKISKGENFVDSTQEGDEVEILTNQTPFYAESGGQVGDQGVIYSKDCKVIIKDTQKKMGDLHVHIGKVEKGNLDVKQSVNLEIDISKRNNARAYHSATHLLHEALRRTLGKHVTQKGSLVSSDKLRFDFSHNKPIEKKEIEKVEKYVNDMIETKTDVKTRIMTPKEAIAQGALAMFGEKYGDEVRVLSMGKENGEYFSTELCGGTHVKNTKDIGRFKIINQSSIAAGVRRIEALRDEQLKNYLNKQDKASLEIVKTMVKKIDEYILQLKKMKIKPVKLNGLTNEKKLKVLTKQFKEASIKFVLDDKDLNQIEDMEVNGIKVRFQKIYNYPTSLLRNVIDHGKKEIVSGIVVSYAIEHNDDRTTSKIGIGVGLTKDLTKKFNAIDLVKEASIILGGKGGGGRPDFAQAGGIHENKIYDSFQKIKSLI